MNTALNFFNAGLAIAVFAGMFWWMYALLTRVNAERELDQTCRRAAIQPWGNDKPGGRGNR